MKKIYLIIMSIVSMCFAGNIDVTTVDPYMLYNGFYITNKGNTDVNGFKFYLYFNAAPVEDLSTFSADILRKRDGDSYVYDRTVLPRVNPEFKRLSATQFVAVFDYSNAVIPARGRFPVPGKPNGEYQNMAIMINGANDDWARFLKNDKAPNILRAYVVESLSGEVLVSRKVKYNNKTKYDKITENKHPTIDNYRRIGVLTNEMTCDEFKAGNQNNLLNTITIDAENQNNQTSIQGATPIGIYSYVGVVRFRYCTLAIQTIPRTPYDYMVLKLDSECPEGSYPVTRNHDTEDKGNLDSYSGNIWPSSVVKGTADAKLEYCYVPKVVNSTLKYPFDPKYGVFASSGARRASSEIATSTIFVDDENTNNRNWWSFRTVPLHLQSRMQAIMSGDHDTEYNVIQWTGSDDQRLAKAAVEIADAPISAEKTLVAAVPQAPAIKGLNRSAVAVELKSEGNVKVSIVNVNGSVIASLAQENLQAGVHQIKWNSGMVPSGRYIVKVEQNGMVNAKNVILK